jgi:hypothetical protein
MQNRPILTPEYFFLRCYRDDGKIRFEALHGAIKHREIDLPMTFYGGDSYQAIIWIYFDGLETDARLNERIVEKVSKYFSKKWFTRPIKFDSL